MRHKLFWILLLACIGMDSSLAQAVFQAKVGGSKFTAKTPFKVTFELKNATGSGFEPPSFKGFEVLSGPSRMNMVNIVNGYRTSSTSFSYEIMAAKPGKYTIGKASITVNGKRLYTRPIPITAIRGKEPATKAKQEELTIIRLQTDTGRYYVGQQIILSLKLLTSQNILDYDVRFNPDFTDAYLQEINVPLHKTREIVDGREYASYVLKRYAFYPQRAGTFKLPSALVQIGVEDPNAPPRRSFFFDPPMKRYQLVTDPIELKVNDLPDGAPPSFAGAIGHYSARFYLNHRNLTTDDAAKLTLQIVGDGDIKINEAPHLDFGEDIDVYDPILKNERPLRSEDRIRFQKNYEYALIPLKPGQYPIVPEFTYFLPDSQSYKTIYADTTILKVVRGISGNHVNITEETDLYDLRDIHYSPSLGGSGFLLFEHPVFWIGVLFIALWMVGIYYQSYLIKKESAIDPLLRKKQQASQMARKHLSKAMELRHTEDASYYKAIQEGIIGYLKDKLGMRTSQINKENIRNVLEDKGISSSLIEETLGLINTCDAALYALKYYGETGSSLIQKAENLLQSFEESLD